MNKFLLALMVMLIPLLANAQNQNQQTQQAISALKKKLNNSNQNKVKWITAKDLQDATLISYYFNNGAVAPGYQWACCIEVTQQDVSVVVAGGLTESEVYRESVRITSEQFDKLKKKIVSVGIGKNNGPAEFLCDGGGSRFEIKKGRTVVFTADNEYIECKQGDFFSITSIFNDLLTVSMKNAVKDPGELINNIELGIDPY